MKFSLKSIAVLPFVNMSNDIDNEYFCDGITEEIINALTKVKELKVIARTSCFAFKGKNVDVRKVGKQLGVTTLLEGSVRKDNKRLRITAQLIDTVNGSHYWSKNFDRKLDNIFELQDEISVLIANKVRENFGHFNIEEHLVKNATSNVAAYELFLQGRYYQLKWTSDSLNTAIKYYNKAIAKDVNYAKAYYANLQCYGLLATWGYMPYEEGNALAEKNFLKAKEIDKQLPEYPLSFVGKFFWGLWDFKLAYQFIQQVLNINPNHIDGLEALVELFIANGFFKEALFYANKLLEVDPLSANNHYTLAHVYYYQGKYTLAIAQITNALNIRPDFELAKSLHAFCLIWLQKKDTLKEFHQNTPFYKEKLLLYDIVNEENTIVPNEYLEETLKNNETSITLITPFRLFILANSKEHQSLGFNLLSNDVEKRRVQVINFRQEPFLKKLESNPEFNKLHVSNLLISDVSTTSKEIKDNTKEKLALNELQNLKDAILIYFKEEQPYLDPQLSLSSLATYLKTTSNKISYVINETLDANFNELVNSYRLVHFKELAVNTNLKHITILGLAYDSGFNSKSVFNTYFKKIESITPSKWVKMQRQ